LISKYDKTGKVNKEHDKVLNEFYEIESEEDQTKQKFYDKDGKFNWNPEAGSSDDESQYSEEGEIELEEGEAELEEKSDDEKVWD